MALTNNNLEIIKALAKNDMHRARTAALASLAEDTSKKNAGVIAQYKKMLTGNASTMMSNLPTDMQTILVGEAPAGFHPERYYIREAEQAVIDDVAKMRRIAEAMWAEHGIPYRNATLLHGPSGTGKTELARFIAHKLNLPFFYISFVSTIDSYMGSTAKNLHKVFNFCSAIPCVLMLDEIDCIAATRSAGGSKGADGELERTTITLMQELDRLPNHVTLIAATNRLDMVDEAVMRRFSIKHHVKDMTRDELEAMIRQYLKETNTEKYIDDETIAHLTKKHHNPGEVLPHLVKKIGKEIYEEKKDSLENEEEKEESPNLWEVTYTWKANVAAETEEDAIAIGRRDRNNYRNSGATEQYAAKRAEFIAPTTGKE